MKKRAVFVLAVLCLFAGSGSAFAAGFARQTVQVPGKVYVVVPKDIDGDGLMDLVVSYTVGERPNAKPRIAVFFGRPGGYGAAPDVDVDVPADSCLFDVADVHGAGQLDLVVLRKGAVQARTLARGRAGEWEPLAARGTGVLFPSAAGHLAYDHFVRDWFGDGGVELAIPDYGALAFYRRGEGGKFESAGKATMKTEGYLRAVNHETAEEAGSRLESYAYLPRVFTAPTPEGAEIVLTVGEEIWVYKPHDGRMPEKGTRLFLPILTDAERQADNTNVTTILEDLNGDGWPDLTMIKVGGSLTNFHSAIRIYRGGPSGFETTPAYALDVPGYIPSVRFWDIVGDGKKEMLVPLVEVGLMQLARVFITQSLVVKVQGFRGGDDFYGKNPALTREVTMKVNTERGLTFVGYPPNFSGDFDGDGLPDLLMSRGDGFAVWRNQGNMSFAAEPMMSAAVEPWENVRLADLNGDKRCDLFAWDTTVTARRGKVLILFNQK